MIGRSVALLALWVALWGELSVANMASGVIAVALVTWLFAERSGPAYVLRPWGGLRLLVFVSYSLVTSSLRVALAVLIPTPKRTHPTVQRVRLARGSMFYGAIVANAITLTPGTMTLELDPESLELSVHVLGEVNPAKFAAGVLDLERRVAAAFKERVRA
ncbi:MAG: Na+/H+ antiporter subunit E [Ilumatobacteraceae bacterium]